MGNVCTFSSKNTTAIDIKPIGSTDSLLNNNESKPEVDSMQSQVKNDQEQLDNKVEIDSTTKFIELSKDSIVNSVITKFIERSNFGFKKYGTTLDRKDLTTKDWIQHMEEELMDAILYLEKLRNELHLKDDTNETGTKHVFFTELISKMEEQTKIKTCEQATNTVEEILPKLNFDSTPIIEDNIIPSISSNLIEIESNISSDSNLILAPSKSSNDILFKEFKEFI